MKILNQRKLLKLSTGPEQVFQEQNLSERKYLQGQTGRKRSISIVNHAFKAPDRFSEYRPLLPPTAGTSAAGHGQDHLHVLNGK